MLFKRTADSESEFSKVKRRRLISISLLRDFQISLISRHFSRCGDTITTRRVFALIHLQVSEEERSKIITQCQKTSQVLPREPWNYSLDFAPCQIKIEINIHPPPPGSVFVFILIHNTGRKKIKIETFSHPQKENNDTAMDGWMKQPPGETMRHCLVLQATDIKNMNRSTKQPRRIYYDN